MEKEESSSAVVVKGMEEKDKSPTEAELVARSYVSHFEEYMTRIEYVRVDALEGLVETTTTEEEEEEKEKEVLIYGDVLVKDYKGSQIVYDRPRRSPDRVLLSSSTAAAAGGTTDYYLPLSNPSRPIIPSFSCPFWVTFNLWVKLSDDRDQPIVQGYFHCHPIYDAEGVEFGKLLERVIGPVTTGFSIIKKALWATVHNVTITTTPYHDDDDDDESLPPPTPQLIYGTIKAFRFSKSGDSSPSPSPLLLFDKSPDQSLQLNHPAPQSIPLTRPRFPVPVDSVLTITLDLWNQYDNQQIAEGSLHFTPVHDTGRHYKTLTHAINTTDGGRVQASVSFSY